MNDIKNKKRIFIFRLNSPMLIKVVKNLQESSADIVYWEGSKKYFEKFLEEESTNILFNKTIFYNTLLAVRGEYPKSVPYNDFEPLGEEFIKQMSQYEPQIIRMMDSVDFQNTSLYKKQRIYYRYLRYYRGLIKFLEPDAIIFGDVPHIPHQYTLFCIAKEFNVKTIMYRTSQVRGRMIFTEDHRFYKEIENEIKKNAGKNYTLNQLNKDIREYYKKQTDLYNDSTPFYMKDKYIKSMYKGSRIIPSIHNVFKNIVNRHFFMTFFSYIKMFIKKKAHPNLEPFEYSGFRLRLIFRKWRKKMEAFRKEYKSLEIKPDFLKKYIYVALHNQPEATTSSMGGIFVDQILMIEILSKSIPRNWVIYVKESPMQWNSFRGHLGRYEGFYKEIVNLPRVKIIPSEINTFNLIKHSQAVATVTGTVGLEAILRGKPALIFGYVFYMFCEGVFRVKNLEDSNIAMEKIINGYKINKQNVINFLYSLDKISIKSYPNIRFGRYSNINEKENIENITNALLNKL